MKTKKQCRWNWLMTGLVLLAVGGTRAATGTWDGTDSAWDTTASHWTGVSGTPWDATNGGTNSANIPTGSAKLDGTTVYASNITMSATVSAHVVITNSGKLYTSGGPSYIGVLNSQTGNRVTVTGGGSLWDNGAKELSFGNNAAPYNGVLAVTDNGVVTNVGTLTVGRQGGTNHWVNITGGGKVCVTGAVSIVQNAKYCGILVSGTNSLLDCKGGISYNLNNAVLSYSKLIVTDGGAVTNAGAILFNAVGHSIAVTNGGMLSSSGAITMGASNLNSSILIGTNSLWNAGGGALWLRGTSNTVTATDGGIITNMHMNNTYGYSAFNKFVITNGGKVYLGAGIKDTQIGYRSGDSKKTFFVTGSGSLLNNGGVAFYIGVSSGTETNESNNALRVDARGEANGITTLSIGNYASVSANSTQVTGGGLLEINTGITVGKNADATSMSNSVTVSGGVLQFTNAAPTINVYNSGSSGNSFTIDGGTVSFRAVTNATVLCSKTGTLVSPKVTWLGENTFRLNAATNAASNQAYTFANTLGATNFVALSLFNGACWRGGTATIGSGGALEVGLGANYLATNVTFETGSELRVSLDGTAVSSLLSTSAALTLGGSLKVTLGFAPAKDTEYPVIQTSGAGSISGSFASSKVTANYGGKEYELTVRKSETAVSVVWATKGTFISFL
jgi:T5SS/PEP-CTERM-associated repeat protein